MARLNALSKSETSTPSAEIGSPLTLSTSPSSYERPAHPSTLSSVSVTSNRARIDSVLAPGTDTMCDGKVFPDEALRHLPFVANAPAKARHRLTPRTFACLTIGSRGDIQPYIALGLRLMKDGHKVVIITHGMLARRRSTDGRRIQELGRRLRDRTSSGWWRPYSTHEAGW
jgi:hypothetical protein